MYDCVTGQQIEDNYGCIMADEMVIVIIIIAFKGAIWDFVQSPHWPRTVSGMYAQVARELLCANHMQHIERLSRETCHVPLGTKGQLSY